MAWRSTPGSLSRRRCARGVRNSGRKRYEHDRPRRPAASRRPGTVEYRVGNLRNLVMGPVFAKVQESLFVSNYIPPLATQPLREPGARAVQDMRCQGLADLHQALASC